MTIDIKEFKYGAYYKDCNLDGPFCMPRGGSRATHFTCEYNVDDDETREWCGTHHGDWSSYYEYCEEMLTKFGHNDYE